MKSTTGQKMNSRLLTRNHSTAATPSQSESRKGK